MLIALLHAQNSTFINLDRDLNILIFKSESFKKKKASLFFEKKIHFIAHREKMMA